MFDTLLFLHFIGISIGAGTGVYMMALARHAAKNMDQAEARTLMPGVVGTISGVGTLGLVLLIASGVAMSAILGNSIYSGMFIAKMVLVAVLVTFVVAMKYLERRVRLGGDMSAARLMKKIAILGPVLGLSTIFTAVMAFH